MQWSVPLTRGTPAAYAPAAPRVAVRSLRTFGAYEMKKQPDFAELFRQHFGGKPSKVTYQVRPDYNRLHDLLFLNSLIHEARIKPSQFRLRDSRLSIPIERVCYELPQVLDPNMSSEWYIAAARLTISAVQEIEWRFAHGVEFRHDKDLWITGIWTTLQSSESDGTMPLVISGPGWECVLKVDEWDLKLRLQDLERPYLYSEKEKDRTSH